MDAVRVMAVMAVIVIHISPFAEHHLHFGVDFNPGVFINQVARFAVPFFFVISGYFWASRFRPGESPLQPSLRTVKRISFLFLAWSALYLLPTNISAALADGPTGLLSTLLANIQRAADHPIQLILEGTKVHLWFLVGLLCSVTLSSMLLAMKLPRTLIVVAIALYLVGLCGNAYSDTPIGFQSSFNFRDGPFFALLFFASGYFLQRRGPQPSWLKIGVLLTMAGYTLHFAELYLLKHVWGASTMQDYVLGTYFVGVGVAMMALANPRFLRVAWVLKLGPLVLGVYLVHFAFIDLLQPLGGLFSSQLGWSVAYPMGVFALSVAWTKLISQGRLAGLVR